MHTYFGSSVAETYIVSKGLTSYELRDSKITPNELNKSVH